MVKFSPRQEEYDESNNMETVSLMSKGTYPHPPPGSGGTGAGSSHMAMFMKEIDLLQQDQATYIKKIQIEKKRKIDIDENLNNIKNKLRDIQQKTRNGGIVIEDDQMHRKVLNKLEHKIEKAKMKLSVIRRDNQTLKKKIDETRKDKLMHISIVYKLERDLADSKKLLLDKQKDITAINDKKHATQLEIASLKYRMVRDMEEFTQKVTTAKHDIHTTQDNIMEAIRERLQSTFSPRQTYSQVINRMNNNNDNNSNNDFSSSSNNTHFMAENVKNTLEAMGLSSVEDLIQSVQKSEEEIFAKYTEIQADNREYGKIETENKKLNRNYKELQLQIEELESHNIRLKEELELQITTMQKNILKYDIDYNNRLQVLNGVSEGMINILRNISIDENAHEQQLLSTGLTDRNTSPFLALIEERTDELIQMSKAAYHESISKDDFHNFKFTNLYKMQAPTLPSADYGDDEDDFESNFVINNNNKHSVSKGNEENKTDMSGYVAPISITQLKEYMDSKLKNGGPIVNHNFLISTRQSFASRSSYNST